MKKLSATLLLMATLNASTPILNYQSPLNDFNEINPKILVNQMLGNKIPNQENGELSHEIIKHNKNQYHIIKLDNTQTKYDIDVITCDDAKYIDDLICDKTDAGVNASFFTTQKTIGLVRRDGKNINGNSKINGSGYFVVENGISKIIREIDDTTKYETILQSFPLLEYEGEILSVKNGKKSYRTAIALDKEHNLYLIATNTNPFKQNKVTMSEFSNFIESQNYEFVLNLDGGKSTQMHFKANNENYFIKNHRPINNAIVFKKK